MWCCLHFRSTCSHVSGSRELHMRHVIDGKASLPKNSCVLTFPIYWPCLSFRRHVFWESVMFLLVQNLFDNSLSIFSFAIHLSMLGYSMEISSRFIFLSCFVRCFSRNLIGPLSGVESIDGHSSLW